MRMKPSYRLYSTIRVLHHIGVCLGALLALVLPQVSFCDQLWLNSNVNGTEDTFEQINASTGTLVQTIRHASSGAPLPLGGKFAYGAGYLWLYSNVNGTEDTFEQINPSTGALVQTIRHPSSGAPLPLGGNFAYGAGYLWLYSNVNGTEDTFEQINASTGALVQTIRHASSGAPLPLGGKFAFGAGYLWLYSNVNGTEDTFEQINASTGALVQTTKHASSGAPLPLGGNFAVGAGYLWLDSNVNGTEDTFEQINASTGVLVQTTKHASSGAPLPLGGNFGVEAQWNVTTSSSPSIGGNVSGGGAYDDWTIATVTATPNSCYSFVNWTASGSPVNSSPSYSFTVTTDQSLVANFDQITYALTTSASPTAGGTISGGGTVDCGASVTLVATPNPCYSFENWTEGGTVLSASTNYSLTASGNLSVVANFVPLAYVLSTTNSPSGAGKSSGGGTLNCGSTAQITAAPNLGFIFTGWSGTGPGSYTGTNNPASVTMDGPISEIADYAAITSYVLGISNLVEGPKAGTDTVVLSVRPETAAWTATTNAGWLHLSTQSQNGVGSTNLLFGYDANPGTTRTGQLTIGGVPFSVTQAGSNYVAAPGPVTSLISSGLDRPNGVAADASNDVYIADTDNNALKKWTATGNNVTTLVASNVNTPLDYPQGIATDAAGNVYIADTGDGLIKEWVTASSNLITLPISGLNMPSGVAVDEANNVYVVDVGNNAIKEWVAASNSVVTLVSGLISPYGIAVDRIGNIYYTSVYLHGITELTSVTEITAANGTKTELVSGLDVAKGLAVDGSGNIYIATLSSG